MTKEAPYKGPGADSEEKREPVSDIDIAVADSLKVLDLKRPIREATYLPRGNETSLEPPDRGDAPTVAHQDRGKLDCYGYGAASFGAVSRAPGL